MGRVRVVADAARQAQQEAGMEPGIQIKFESFPGIELAFEKLAREHMGIELLSVHDDHTKTRRFAPLSSYRTVNSVTLKTLSATIWRRRKIVWAAPVITDY